MSHVFHRNLNSEYPVAVQGDGVYIIDDNGNRYLDACGGAAVSCLGHSDTSVTKRLQQQAVKLSYAHSGFFTTEPMEQLAKFLASHSPEGLDHIYFVSGGSEAVESALKLARQYYVEKGQPERKHIIARKQSYHGNTLGALSAGGNQWRREPFSPLLVNCSHVSACNYYRDALENEAEFDYGQRLVTELEEEIINLGPDSVMAFIAEPIVGATMGAVPAVKGYFQSIRKLCDKYGILLILDEVMCGMGRTGSLFTCEQEGVIPDLLCVAKGLGAGYQPIGATLVQQHIYQTIKCGSGYFQHGHTYIGHALACAASLEVQQQIQERNLLNNVQQQGVKLEQKLRENLAEHPNIGDIRGRGLFWGIELVADKHNKKPFSQKLSIHSKIKKQAMKNGLMCYPMGGTIDGQSGDHILLAPPFIISDEEIDIIVDKLTLSCKQVFNTL